MFCSINNKSWLGISSTNSRRLTGPRRQQPRSCQLALSLLAWSLANSPTVIERRPVSVKIALVTGHAQHGANLRPMPSLMQQDVRNSLSRRDEDHCNDEILLLQLQYGSALALAYAGDNRRAQKLTDDLGQRFLEATIVQFNYLPTLRAKLAVSQGHASDAVEILRAAIPYELGYSTYSTYGWTGLYPAYERGEAYLAASQGSDATTEFQKILDHSGIVVNAPIGALAHLQLGRAYAMQSTPLRQRLHIKISSHFGRTPTPTSPS